MSDNTFPTYIDVRIDEMKLIVRDDMMSVTPEIVAENVRINGFRNAG